MSRVTTAPLETSTLASSITHSLQVCQCRTTVLGRARHGSPPPPPTPPPPPPEGEDLTVGDYLSVTVIYPATDTEVPRGNGRTPLSYKHSLPVPPAQPTKLVGFTCIAPTKRPLDSQYIKEEFRLKTCATELFPGGFLRKNENPCLLLLKIANIKITSFLSWI